MIFLKFKENTIVITKINYTTEKYPLTEKLSHAEFRGREVIGNNPHHKTDIYFLLF